MNKSAIFEVFIAFIISFLLIQFTPLTKNTEPHQLYRVYLKGKSLGLIASKDSLESYIDKKQNIIKEKYNVKKVYMPDELDIKKEITYDNNVLSTKKIYEKIKDISNFTVEGYRVRITGLDKTTDGQKQKVKDVDLYVLDKSIFKNAVKKTVQSFITKEKYNEYKDKTQKEIKDTGTIIENLYIKNKITIKETKIPVDKTIYQNEDDVSKILLFGTTDEQQKYKVKAGDTIEDVAFNNKISTEEFLIANNNFKDKNSLLFEGQEVTIGIMHPQFSLVEEDHTVSDQEVNYETEVKYDTSKSTNYSQVEQAGVKGKNRVTQKIQKVNGETTNVVTVKTEQLTAPIKEIVVKGGKQNNYLDSSVTGYGSVIATKGQWGWPATCQTISSPFGYRWGVLHDGTDIAGCGYGSNIFAAQAGTVVKASSKYDNGIYVVIDHHNGYHTLYAHLSSYAVREGQTVSKGQVIGYMGQTGFATGVHLHFAIWIGFPYSHGSKPLNAMTMY